MTLQEAKEILEENEAEFLKFERIQQPKAKRPDLAAFLLLDEIVPPSMPMDMISSAEHDEIWLNTSLDALLDRVTPSQLVDLYRCGIRIDEDLYSLAMFV